MQPIPNKGGWTSINHVDMEGGGVAKCPFYYINESCNGPKKGRENCPKTVHHMIYGQPQTIFENMLKFS